MLKSKIPSVNKRKVCRFCEEKEAVPGSRPQPGRSCLPACGLPARLAGGWPAEIGQTQKTERKRRERGKKMYVCMSVCPYIACDLCGQTDRREKKGGCMRVWTDRQTDK